MLGLTQLAFESTGYLFMRRTVNLQEQSTERAHIFGKVTQLSNRHVCVNATVFLVACIQQPF